MLSTESWKNGERSVCPQFFRKALLIQVVQYASTYQPSTTRTSAPPAG
jgi:hypothetical protein